MEPSSTSVISTAPTPPPAMWPLTRQATQTLNTGLNTELNGNVNPEVNTEVNTEVVTEVNTQEPTTQKAKHRSWLQTLQRGSTICCCFPSSTHQDETRTSSLVNVVPAGILQPHQGEESYEMSVNVTTDDTRPLSDHSIALPVQGVHTFGEALSSYEEEGGRPFSLQLPIQGAQQRFPRDSIDNTIEYAWDTMESQNQPESTTDLGLDPETAAILSKSFHPPTSPPPPRPPRSPELTQTSSSAKEDPPVLTYSPRTPQRSATNLTLLTVPPIPEEITEPGTNEPVSSPSSELPYTKSMAELHSAKHPKRRPSSTPYETKTLEDDAMDDAIMFVYPEDPDTPEGSEHGGGLEMRRISSTGRFRPPPIFTQKDSGDSSISLPHIGPLPSGDSTRADLVLTRTNSAESTQSVERVTRIDSRQMPLDETDKTIFSISTSLCVLHGLPDMILIREASLRFWPSILLIIAYKRDAPLPERDCVYKIPQVTSSYLNNLHQTICINMADNHQNKTQKHNPENLALKWFE
ncbi:hypothetical protein TREMEDRAFT_62958 [Tremella mesenterica DSM 1558]|uniref:uncharacterized protein n=1 Tax=Tremella mesenterica (strain ATCC 24925 / CBS 8224 / DSM 1558 / NBRC 9311 / NRRL Y-6157 / RJB 2259-6 / UBC 559-6) TaxID=578456 RepID=UPI0003F490E7|nr:uncharacterized protein TREMEDRAFT_62958 [Tremella mesenterica DSM 1558]EIW69226.1 hypothetical protein TREMEDRAFT_62958 [Tremella mesenterica DSM 1558]